MYFRNLPNDEKSRLADYLQNMRVNLFLGSGVSLDSIGLKGAMLSAGDLTKKLVEVNSLPVKASLQQAYSALDLHQIKEEIANRYTCADSGETIERLAFQP